MATADFILGTTCRSTARKSLGVWIAALATTVTLAGCSSQPETADIQKDLTEAYACPILELSEVKKVDGAANGKAALSASSNPEGIKQHQAQWRRAVRDVCTTPECVTTAYQQRLAELK